MHIKNLSVISQSAANRTRGEYLSHSKQFTREVYAWLGALAWMIYWTINCWSINRDSEMRFRARMRYVNCWQLFTPTDRRKVVLIYCVAEEGKFFIVQTRHKWVTKVHSFTKITELGKVGSIPRGVRMAVTVAMRIYIEDIAVISNWSTGRIRMWFASKDSRICATQQATIWWHALESRQIFLRVLTTQRTVRIGQNFGPKIKFESNSTRTVRIPMQSDL